MYCFGIVHAKSVLLKQIPNTIHQIDCKSLDHCVSSFYSKTTHKLNNTSINCLHENSNVYLEKQAEVKKFAEEGKWRSVHQLNSSVPRISSLHSHFGFDGHG